MKATITTLAQASLLAKARAWLAWRRVPRRGSLRDLGSADLVLQHERVLRSLGGS